MKSTLLIILLLLTGCGAEPPDHTEALAQLSDIAISYGLEPIEVEVTFSPLTLPVIGHCDALSTGKITLDPDYWAHVPTCMQRMLLAHEIGHCVYGLTHGEGLMSPQMTNDCAAADALIEDFFSSL